MSKKSRRVAKARRALLTLSLVLVTMVVAVGGTIAWLTDSTSEITNTFTPSTIDIDLAETTGTSYKMVPGSSIEKDPEVTVVKGSEKSWVFVELVENPGIETDTTTDPDTVTTKLFTNYLTYSIADGWTLLSESTNANVATKVYYRVVGADTVNDQKFDVIEGDTLTVESGLTKSNMDNLTTNPSLVVTAYAIQYDGFEPEVTEGVAEATAAQIEAAAQKAWGEIK